MRKASFIWPITFLTMSCFLSACGKPPMGPPPVAGTPVVGVMTVREQSVALTTELPGRTVAYLIADVRPQVNGIIKARNFREGSDVKAGQTLYQINPASYQAAYDSNVAALAKVQASLKTARLKSDRYKELVAIKAVSQQEYDDADSNLGEIEADIAAAKANVETSRINLAYARVDAPISGRIGRSTVTPGALVTASQTSAMATIQQLDPIYVDVTQPSAALLDLKESLANGELQKAGTNAAKVSLVLENGRTYPLEGQLEFSDVTVNQDTGAITLRAVFPNPNADLLPGMYVRAVLQIGVKEQGLLVPQQAVTRDSTGKPTVYVVGKDRKLERRVLETDRAIGDQWLVRSGLVVGDQLVVDGQQRAAPGVEVQVTPWPSNPPSTPSIAEIPAIKATKLSDIN
ncbi:efflux RND transporter periplasmic adaptor subunit [Pseudomonas brassicacearum]|uniref:efflux RND transporter periplasmic adaptor subunit n=1 Tax=Pseudomonas TaxID=286 RepID=UPI000484FBFF|nr:MULTISPECIES: efflux RND transporter periplasmic adaptor subunit [Pseudomonas]RDI07501.1 membrane fusion protein (multidrug efflux system) [Pseudomonas fluorescens]ROM86530.1 efflux transporter periplasmic adaptor subunit [Pseudomonas brassicacearum]ROM98341.1 efflux transporter periplasmic adaptor subunit [Pseudomonas brassicacearum]RON04308.1 efflux transporter periplasmic adaptor subunit [Pseudomonas brassicacearum]UVM47191.1 efflux RND transporter periplasmic adaptor subunit [Pseudomona